MAKYQDALICLKHLDNKMEDIKKEHNEIWTKLFGKPTSMFYGLKCPGKFKCISMIGEEYDISPDLVMLLQDLIIKGNRKHMINGYIENYPVPIDRMNKTYQYRGRWIISELKPNQRNSTDYSYKPQKRIKNAVGEYLYKPVELKYEYSTYNIPKNYCIEVEGGITLGDLAYTKFKWKTARDWHRNNDNHIGTYLALFRKNELGEETMPHKIIDKKTLIEQCEQYTDKPIKKSWNKKQLYNHLIKYA